MEAISWVVGEYSISVSASAFSQSVRPVKRGSSLFDCQGVTVMIRCRVESWFMTANILCQYVIPGQSKSLDSVCSMM